MLNQDRTAQTVGIKRRLLLPCGYPLFRQLQKSLWFAILLYYNGVFHCKSLLSKIYGGFAGRFCWLQQKYWQSLSRHGKIPSIAETAVAREGVVGTEYNLCGKSTRWLFCLACLNWQDSWYGFACCICVFFRSDTARYPIFLFFVTADYNHRLHYF